MTTTSLIVEILVVGFTFLFGVFLIFLGLTDVSLECLIPLSGWCTLIIFFAFALAYSIGWVVNNLTFYITLKCCERNNIRKSFKWKNKKDDDELDRAYRDAHTKVLMDGSEALIQHLDNELAAIRIARCSVPNFFLIGIGLLIFPGVIKAFGFFAFLIMVFSAYMWSKKTDQYFERLALAYKSLGDSTKE